MSESKVRQKTPDGCEQAQRLLSEPKQAGPLPLPSFRPQWRANVNQIISWRNVKLQRGGMRISAWARGKLFRQVREGLAKVGTFHPLSSEG